MRVEFIESTATRSPNRALIAFVHQDGGLASAPGELADDAAAALRSVAARNRFTGAADKVLVVAGITALDVDLVVLAGLGKADTLTASTFENAAARAFAALIDKEIEQVELLTGSFAADLAAHAAFGARLAAYKFDRLHTVRKRKLPASLLIRTGDPAAATLALQPLTALADGIVFARDLVSEPPNLLYPESFVERLQATLADKGVEVSALDEAAMAALGMGALLAVGQGSARESRLAICRWQGAANPDAPPLVLVGKGVTFDSGGLSLKPTKDMEPMKQDMGGAAAIAGVLLTLAARKAKVNVVGVLGLVENMPDGAAYRPSDIITTMAGTTIEIVNTDAEGRLVLADALYYARQTFAPRAMIDLATLTGHASYALGNDYAAILANDDAWCEQIVAAGAKEGEMMWRLPLVAAYDKLHDTPDADMKNVGGHPEAGAITAALLLQRFVGTGVPWAHLDIAGVAWRSRDDQPTVPKGATGYGVRTLDRLIADRFEDAD